MSPKKRILLNKDRKRDNEKPKKHKRNIDQDRETKEKKKYEINFTGLFPGWDFVEKDRS
ncbi:predicted protein [Sclerotinia sclerotiorum 1980 UF-70]|uniref:Uncharacterized protein n=2 Tax=Sclerotinia sclerotiorum (strain ATCC 18683 / 1980 / Ss-1) TaxID=665079 RepID=A7EBF6_SCLS1|nr:predicted protein [Sclerotinia sclerotiorum 1980 UF-70]APA08840.1 hypothetical protein sscle_04g036100 [Sclerotinia sclerotiorum 1980 UF-70]EDN99784.1 predicted protein [Sclerotinia sclerotiorum 1980 UF-70]